MPDTSFVDNVTTLANRVVAAWLNQVNKWLFWGRRPNYTTTTGSANAQVLTLETASLYSAGTEADGDEFWFTAGFTNSAAMTLQVKTPTGANVARAVQLNQQALVGGEVFAGSVYKVQRLGTTWQLFNLQQLVDGQPIAVGSADPTKKLRFSLAGFTTAVTRIMTWPDQSGTILLSNALTGSALGFSMINGTLVPSQNGTVLTIAIKTLAGADPSASDPVYVLFRSATAGTGDYTVITLTAATSIATTVGGTFGVANSVSFRLWVVGFNDGGTFRLALINCLSTVAGAGAGRDVTAVFPLAQFAISSATQIGAGSTLSQTFYSAGAAVTSKAYTVLGYLTYESGLATAGTFGMNQSRTDLFRSGMPLPGWLVQTQRNDTGANATGTTIIPLDDTIPQITEGDQYMTQAITPSSAANVLAITSEINASVNAADYVSSALFQDATANALAAVTVYNGGSNQVGSSILAKKLLASTTVATTFRVRVGPNGANTVVFNGFTGNARRFALTFNSYIEALEIMG